jgi:hypothetical protein
MTEMSRITEHERFMITRARERGAVRRASSDVLDKLDGNLLDGLADLAERLAGPAPDKEDDHD